MQEAAQQPILIKRIISLAEKSRFGWIKCSSDGGATETSVTTLDPGLCVPCGHLCGKALVPKCFTLPQYFL